MKKEIISKSEWGRRQNPPMSRALVSYYFKTERLKPYPGTKNMVAADAVILPLKKIIPYKPRSI